MKRIVLSAIILSLGVFTSVTYADVNSAENKTEPSQAVENTTSAEQDDTELPSIFIWQIPDDTLSSDDNVDDDTEDVITDDATDEDCDGAITLDADDNTTVKGYLEYMEGAESIGLKDDKKDFVLNLSVPQKFSSTKVADNINLPQTSFAQNIYARSGDIAYNIAPLNTSAVATKGNFSIGTSYNESIDTSDLGFTTSFFTKYDRKYFSLSTSFDKNAGVAYSLVVDKFNFTPEIKLNDYISIKDILTSDITRNRRQNSLVLSIKPTKDDRLRFEFGAGQTYDESRALIKSQVNFSTQFQW